MTTPTTGVVLYKTDGGQGGLRGELCTAGLRMLRLWQCLRPRTCIMLLAVMVTAGLLISAVVMEQSLSLTALLRHVWKAPENCSCTPRTNIAFLKSHKCASSSIQNILFRYGVKHNLRFALPDGGNYFGNGLVNFKAEMVHSSFVNKYGTNIFAIHTKWDYNEVRKVMPEDTVYFTIVREPTELFKSLFAFYSLKNLRGMTMEQFVRHEPADAKRTLHHVGFNQMTWDFGMPERSLTNLTAVHEMVLRAEKQFGLVLVAERMEESLVLLAKYLCWELSDVVVLKLNALRNEYKEPLSPGAQELLKRKLAPDYLLYRHFTERFQRNVEAFGQEKMEKAVARLQELKEQLMNKCDFVAKTAAKIDGVERPWSDKVDGFVGAGGDECNLYSLPELPFIDSLREKQMKEIRKWYNLLA